MVGCEHDEGITGVVGEVGRDACEFVRNIEKGVKEGES